jgi:patatin-like phospholipase/acyl hydrolase
MKVLAIDGGGIRGLIPALVLAEVEKGTGKPISACFDLIAGTSTGGLLACGLTRPDSRGKPMWTAAELAALYEEEGPNIFRRSLRQRVASLEGLVDERYDDAGLNAALERALGDSRLRDVLCDVFVTAYDIQGRFAFFFRSSRARTDPTYDFSLVQTCRATAAAPTYFEPVEVSDAAQARTYPLIDGGVYAINPAMCAYADVSAGGRAGELELIASLGTGELTRPIPFDRAVSWGQIGWARPLLDVMFDGMADTVDFQLGALLETGYVRLQTRLREASDDLDDASPDNLAALRREAEKLIAQRRADIDALCAQLSDN